ncbi:N-methyl-L-tryptophan oxidase [uncultured Meiothermus sp.]|jgi:sarcosine oxidase|uniref:N-methyl-L-tryptophan oxidase n=1 Tax=uncultured Meiothermus sp. TaxID=157471 RepID=UPI00261786CA|nr:N-methyl-L-tryptophan oxidase [uncultured Meiothermus sp.]
MPSADVIVVGLGAMGSASLYQLARRGARVIGIDRHRPPHIYGSSHGETRITRQAIGEGAAYVPLVLRSHQIWRELEAQTGESLLRACGGLILSGEVGEALHHGKPQFLQRTLQAAQQFGIAHEVLNATQIGERFPQFDLTGDETGYFEPGAGLVYPERCVQVQLEQAQSLGAVWQTGETVLQISPTPDGVQVETDKARYHAAKVVVSAGSWAGELLGEPFARVLRVYRQVLFWLEAKNPQAYLPERFPIFIWMFGSAEGEHFYGLPQVSQGVKVATEQSRVSTHPDQVERTVAEAEAQTMFTRYVQGRLKGLGSTCLKAATCLYTSTPDGDFILDHHPDSERILVASPCSGHGFKHSASVGEAMAELALHGRSQFDLTPFRLAERPAWG